MPDGLIGADPLVGPLLQQHPGQALGERNVVQPGPHMPQPLTAVVTHFVGLVVRQLGHPGPRLLGGGTHHAEDLVQLIEDVPHAGEARVPVQHFDEDATNAPDVEGGVVVGGPQQDVRGTVPQCDDLVRVRVRRDRLGTSQTCKGIWLLSSRNFIIPLGHNTAHYDGKP